MNMCELAISSQRETDPARGQSLSDVMELEQVQIGKV